MHTNAGMVTALQQAVAHLSSALETQPQTKMCSFETVATWMHKYMPDNMLTGKKKVFFSIISNID